ncbi:LysM peptidoglycan-binding domain-containing protein [Thalassotalea marina]|uniref:LysM domain-containing protein n=1 Tax=Thalassotalea marina TaxID=1673741 RepID=A0A919BSI9_9GAMM|nr:LysM peptidoglycan-binding domain-containing protein [Thalassotalea marina]GHG07040.1 hypothetical protein GCM10017161_40830 [Thalassotalea marina]
MRSAKFAILVVCSCSYTSNAYNYEIQKGETLWSLSKAYLNNPYLWRTITYVDGTKIIEPTRIPTGAKLYIPESNRLIQLHSQKDVSTEIASTKQLATSMINTHNQSLASSQPELSNQKKLHQYPSANNRQTISNPSITALVKSFTKQQKNKLYEYYLSNNNGSVRAFYNGQEVVVDTQILIEEMRHIKENQK